MKEFQMEQTISLYDDKTQMTNKRTCGVVRVWYNHTWCQTIQVLNMKENKEMF